MPLYTTLASLSQTAASNAADGAVDAPSTIDQQTNLLASFIAQLRDGSFGTGQCRLVKSGSNLVLQPYNGNRLTINGTGCIIPSAGVSLAPTSLTPGTTYYIYAVASGTAVGSLEASTTGHSTDTTTGVEIKTGDATRTLVGMARVITGPAWQDTGAQRYVVSWFNRRTINVSASSVLAGAVSSTSPTEVTNGPRAEFLAWGDEGITAFASGMVVVDASPRIAYTYCSLDTVTQATGNGFQAWSASAQGAIANTAPFSPAEGYHYLAIYGQVTSGVSTWSSGATVSGALRG